MTNTVLIVGATGVVGDGAMGAFAAQGNRVLALSRRKPEPLVGDVSHLPLDLLNAEAVAQAAAELAPVTHVVYAALFEKPGLLAGWLEQDQMRTNLSMLQNLLEPLLAAAPNLQHISLLQGTKAYGAHVHAIANPARESSPRDNHENFYWLQEDYLKSRLATTSGRVGYTLVRPQIVFGSATKSAMNVIPVLGAYGALLKAAGEPLHFPGGDSPLGHETIQEAVDADLLGRMFCWAAEADAARNQVFNVTNGDVYVWRNLWPTIAQALGMTVGEDRPLSLAAWLPEQAERWRALQRSLGLVSIDMLELLGESHHYADALLGVNAQQAAPSSLVSTIKLRQAGFAECIDTEAMFTRLFAKLQQRRLLPPASWDGRL